MGQTVDPELEILGLRELFAQILPWLKEHELASTWADVSGLVIAVVGFAATLWNVRSLRIPVKATTLSGAWRPRDPVDDDQGGARA